jgi:RNA polymerase sigma-70 factor (ECF subfamily)
MTHVVHRFGEAMPFDPSVLSDEQLAGLAAREGSDGPAFTALVERYQDRVWRMCYRLLGSAEDAEDAAQEVFVRLFFHRRKFEGRSKFSTWVYSIALRTCLAQRRSRSRRARRESLAPPAEPRRTAGQAADAALDALQMLEGLDEDDRALVILKYAEGRSHEELAEMFSISVSACKMRISRARDKLKERFPDHDFSGD